MSRLTKIPFGQRVGSDILVAVDNVPNGKNCDCVCPSCQSALIARHGHKNIHHFSHVKSNVVKYCTYNLLFSIRMMYLQLLPCHPSLNFNTPSSLITVAGYLNNNTPLSFQQLVTPEKEIVLTNIKTNHKIGDQIFDCVADVKGVQIAIQLTYKSKSTAFIDNDKTHSIAILEIDLTPLNELIWKKEHSQTYRDLLIDYFCSASAIKRWVYHPRRQKALLHAEKSLQKKINDENHILTKQNATNGFYDEQNFRIYSPKTRLSDYECHYCHKRWPRKYGYICPQCYARCYN
ncbi:hypothetical protein [Photobacterium damselae]|uniref:competence protein CoiA family protein n=1 Tax=Photobacterium damselae TaxID=38293 RepID=UPI002543510B